MRVIRSGSNRRLDIANVFKIFHGISHRHGGGPDVQHPTSFLNPGAVLAPEPMPGKMVLLKINIPKKTLVFTLFLIFTLVLLAKVQFDWFGFYDLKVLILLSALFH